MDRKTFPCLQKASQHVPVYLQQFPSYSNHNCKKIVIFTYPGFSFFCLPWGRPCGNHAKRCMNEKTIMLAKPLAPCTHLSSTVSQLFEPQCKKSPFSRTAAHICVSPGDALRLSRNMLHGWKDNSMLAKLLAACTYLSLIVSELYDA